MAANVENMFYVGRQVPWHGLGVSVVEAPNSAEAIKLAGLNWQVETTCMKIEHKGNDIIVPNVFANKRSTDGAVLGVVTGKYKIVQNEEAFSFTDGLLGEDIKYETAGSLAGGKKIWLLARMPDSEIVGDKFENYLAFCNSHDGKGSVQVAATKVRIVCENTMNLALNTAKRSWSTKHMGNMESKMAEAHRTLELANTYNDAFVLEASKLADEKITDISFELFVQNLVNIPEGATDRIIRGITEQRDDLMMRYMKAPDLSTIRGTKWGVLQAVSDFATHKTPQRNTATHQENLFDETIQGNKLIDKAYDLLKAV